MTAEIVDFLKYRERKKRAENQTRKMTSNSKQENETAEAEAEAAPELANGVSDNDGGNHGGESA